MPPGNARQFWLRQNSQRLFHNRNGPGSLGAKRSDFQGSFEDCANGNETAQFMRRDGSQAHGGHASTRSAVRSAAELARNDFGFEVGGDGLSGECENTLLRV